MARTPRIPPLGPTATVDPDPTPDPPKEKFRRTLTLLAIGLYMAGALIILVHCLWTGTDFIPKLRGWSEITLPLVTLCFGYYFGGPQR